ncbi:CinA family protein, partial [Rhodospirillales bacterium]|nr:CinA family protein [Rhodospirillales bacterium]
WGLCETGASGPIGNSYGDPAGHTAMAAVGPENKSAILKTGSDNRESNMLRFAEGTLQLLRSLLNS